MTNLRSRFLALVRRYVRDSKASWNEVQLRAGIDGLGQWSKSGLPFPIGVLPGEPKIRYFFHSERPELKLHYIDSGKVIDLIFHESELGVFDFWRLYLYAQSFAGEFPEFQDKQTLVNALVDAKQLSLIEPTDWDGVYRLGGGFLRPLAKFLRRNLTTRSKRAR